VRPSSCSLIAFNLSDDSISFFTPMYRAYVYVYHSHPGYFGKCGMRDFHQQKNHSRCPTINLDKVWSLLESGAREQAAQQPDKAAVIDVTQHGFFKVLGNGQLPQQPVLVRARYFSKIAERKIREAGGACQLVA
jgi:large subunit ribosomal protein L27Ae